MKNEYDVFNNKNTGCSATNQTITVSEEDGKFHLNINGEYACNQDDPRGKSGSFIFTDLHS